METDFSSAHLGLWGAFYRKGMRAEALAAARRFFAVLGDGEVLEALRRGESESGYEGAMRLAALELEKRTRDTSIAPWSGWRRPMRGARAPWSTSGWAGIGTACAVIRAFSPSCTA